MTTNLQREKILNKNKEDSMQITISYTGEHQPKLEKELDKALKTIGFEDVAADYDLRKQERRIIYEKST
jgi:hypothetical protein